MFAAWNLKCSKDDEEGRRRWCPPTRRRSRTLLVRQDRGGVHPLLELSDLLPLLVRDRRPQPAVVQRQELRSLLQAVAGQ